MKQLIFFLIFTVLTGGILFSQTDATSESKMNQSSMRIVSGDENRYSSYNEPSKIPANLLQQYNNAVDLRNEELKNLYNTEIEKYLNKPVTDNSNHPMTIVREPGFSGDWYNSDVLITNTDVVSNSSNYRQIDLKQGEDGWLYMAVNQRNTATNGRISIFRSSNGGATWLGILAVTSSGYYSSISMLVESRSMQSPDSTRILVYSTHSMSSNYNDAGLYCLSFRRDGSASGIFNVASPTAGNRFVNVSTSSDGMFFASATYMHVVVREETNAGNFVSLNHYRSTTWGVSHTVGTFNTFNDDRYPVSAFSNETGSDSIYIAVERVVAVNEHEIRLIVIPDLPSSNYSIRYVTDATPGTIYERPSITIQQRDQDLPQNILVTCTKNDHAVYHFSTDGGAVWNIDYGLGLFSQAVDYTTCSSDSLVAGGKDFIATFVDIDGDSVSVRNGTLGNLGPMQHKKNTVASTGVLAPVCAIYKTGNIKNAAFAYAGYGPTGVYYNMETLVTGIQQMGGEVPNGFSLSQNYPNPFNPVTNIKFSIPKSGLVTLKVYDIAGKEVALLVNQNLNAGTFNYDFDASGLSSGVYFYRINAEGFTDVKKMILVK
jgi:hypothetical protein